MKLPRPPTGSEFKDTIWQQWFVVLQTMLNSGALQGYTVATLPIGVQTGSRYFVSDATSTTFASIVAGGGANTVPVFFNGTNWIIG
jgi:hypothetical protein